MPFLTTKLIAFLAESLVSGFLRAPSAAASAGNDYFDVLLCNDMNISAIYNA